MNEVDEDGYPENYPLTKEEFLRAKAFNEQQQQAKESSEDV